MLIFVISLFGCPEPSPRSPSSARHCSQHCCDKTMDGKMALYRECCFPNCKISWWKK